MLPSLFGAAGAGAFGGVAKTGAGVTGAGGGLGAGVVLPFPPPPPSPPLSLFAQTRPSAYPDEIATARHSRPRQGQGLSEVQASGPASRELGVSKEPQEGREKKAKADLADLAVRPASQVELTASLVPIRRPRT